MHRMTREELRAMIRSIMHGLSSLQSELAIVVVANTHTETKTESDYNGQSISTEFFSDLEVQELLADLRSAEIFVTPFYSEQDFMHWILADGHRHIPFDRLVVYNAAQNGTGPGRKSLIPAFCNLHGIPTTGSDAYVVSLCRHKFHLNRILHSCGFSIAKTWWYLGHNRWSGDERPVEGTNVILKLTYESASIGLDEASVGKWGTVMELKAQDLVLRFSQPVVVQEFISGTEVECPIMVTEDAAWCDVVGITVNGKSDLDGVFLTYDMVYNDGYGFSNRQGTPETDSALCDTVVRVSETIGFRGIARVDFRIRDDGRAFITDIATNPHLVSHSSVSFSLRQIDAEIKPFSLLVGLKLKQLGWI